MTISKTKTHIVAFTVLALTGLFMAACSNTFDGMGRDIENTGEAVQDASQQKDIKMINNRMLLIAIVALLAVVVGVMMMNYQNRNESLGDKVGEVIEEVGDEIDDAN